MKEQSHMHHHCVSCGEPVSPGFQAFCSACDDMLDVRYNLKAAKLHDSNNPYERYRDLLPVKDPESLLPSDTTFTPTVHARQLGKKLGMPWLFLKDETRNPTRSTKDRMAAVSLAYLWERGVRHFAASSTGNSSTAYAYAMKNYPAMKLSLFTSENWISRVAHADQEGITHYCLKNGTFVDAFNWAGIHAKRNNITSERGFFNIGRREGLKLAYFEAVDQVPRRIDWYVQAVSSAMGVYGTYKGSAELLGMGVIDQKPKLLCAQQESCSPMVKAFHDGSEHIRKGDVVARPSGIASAILRGDPTRVYPYIRNMVIESQGTFASVSEEEIREARKLIEDLEDISPCFSSSTALASLIKLVRQGNFPIQETVLVNVTGGDRTPASISDNLIWLRRDGDDWVEDSEQERPALAI